MANNSTFSIALSQETGCIVMTRSNGKKVTVIGSLTRDASLDFAAAVINWGTPDAPAENVIRIEVADALKRPSYPH